jgi:hypothetical protein
MDPERSSSTNSSTSQNQELLPCNSKSDPEKTPLENDLPPVDGGFHAWMFLAASTMIEALVWGFAFSFGVFESYYRESDLLKGSNMVAIIGTCATVRIFPFAPPPPRETRRDRDSNI